MSKKKKIVIIISVIVVILLCIFIPISIRFVGYKEFIGEYELAEGRGLPNLELNLYDWSFGKEENLKCDLWNCDGYEHGMLYEVDGNNIIFRFDKHSKLKYNYEIVKEKGNTYLILKDSNYVSKYKKLK